MGRGSGRALRGASPIKILLDTHIILWSLTDNPHLSKKARAIIEDYDNEIYYSIISVWETQIKYLMHKEELPLDGIKLSSYCRYAGYHELGLSDAHISALSKLIREENSPPHKDPFDRILLCQAMEEKMLLLTHDKLLVDYNASNVVLI